MLTIIDQPKSKISQAQVKVPQEISYSNRKRMDGLAEVFYGHLQRAGIGETWIFTQVRGQKFWLLYTQGFASIGVNGKIRRDCIIHPEGGARLYSISEAVACARIMEAKHTNIKNETQEEIKIQTP